MRFCPTCHYYIPQQHFRYTRDGVQLTPTQAHIYDLVKRSAQIGVGIDDLHSMLYVDSADPPGNHAIYVAIHNANERFRLAGVPTRIRGSLGRGAVYRISSSEGEVPKRNRRAG